MYIPHIDRDTRMCISLAAHPGHFGNRFHNFLYVAMKLNFVYKSFYTNDLVGAMRGIRALGIRGCGVTMPFKVQVVRFLDHLDPEARKIGAVNTIINNGQTLKGFNTDYKAVRRLIHGHFFPASIRILVRGSGGMARAMIHALSSLGFRCIWVLARNETQGRWLAKKYHAQWIPFLNDGETFDLLLNATPLGSAVMPGLPFTPRLIQNSRFVMDVILQSSDTELIRLARRQKKDVITGLELTTAQAAAQFVLYTGKKPSTSQIRQAVSFAKKGLF